MYARVSKRTPTVTPQYLTLYITLNIDPLLSGDSVNSDRFGHRLGKRVPVARQQILNNVTVRIKQWNRGFYVVRVEVL
jgi:hypothetical protein